MTASDGFEIREASAEELRPLRVAVLRGGDAGALARDPRDDEPGALHLAAVAEDRIIGGGSFFPSPAPTGTGLVGYQLRYMATDPGRQGLGVGTQLLRAAETRLASRGAEELWANARDTALGFYVRTGWTVLPGSEHVSKETDLPHTVVTRRLRRDEAVVVTNARVGDAADLVALRAEMILAIRLRLVGGDWVAEAERFFAEGLADGTILAVLARTDAGEAAGSAAASLRRDPPSPWNPSGRSAYVHTVATMPGFRRRGVSRELMAALLERLTELGIARVELHATDDGEPLYRDLGFAERGNNREMRLDNTAAVRERAAGSK
jgi:GNAT superfamily N-acetyltransferase